MLSSRVMTIKMKVTAALGVVTCAFLLASCSPGDLIDRAVEKGVEKGIEAATGSEIDIDEDGGQISIATEDGEVSFGSGSELPDGFPDEVPLIDGEITSGMRFSEADSDGYMVGVVVKGAMSDVYAEATGLLEAAGFTESSSVDLGGIRNAIYEPNGAISVGVNFVEEEDEGHIVVSYTVSRDKSA